MRCVWRLAGDHRIVQLTAGNTADELGHAEHPSGVIVNVRVVLGISQRRAFVGEVVAVAFKPAMKVAVVGITSGDDSPLAFGLGGLFVGKLVEAVYPLLERAVEVVLH